MNSSLPKYSRPGILIAILGLVLTSLACQINLGGPDAPGPISPPSGSETELSDLWENAIGTINSSEFKVVFTAEQLTAFLAERMQTSENPLIENPQVFLETGQIQVFGFSERGPFSANILVTIVPSINAENELTLEITSADFGPIPVPDSLKQGISSLITEAFTGSIASRATGIRIKSLSVSDGEMVLISELR
jgi:hypothetical protein